MKKLTTILLAGMMTLAFTACGGGGGSSDVESNPPPSNTEPAAETPIPPTIDNSVLADDSNDYGYYGKDVLFGEDIAVGLWHGTSDVNGEHISNYVSMYDDGFTSQGHQWGVSKDGQQLLESDGEIIDIVTSLGGSCYNVNVFTSEGRNIPGKICKINDLSEKKWSNPESITNNFTNGYALSPQIAMDKNGNAIAAWNQHDGIYANQYIAGKGWQGAEKIGNDLFGAMSIEITMNDEGIAVVLMIGYSSGTPMDLYANRFVPGSGWGMPTLLYSDTSYEQKVSIDKNGNAIVVFFAHNGNSDTSGNLWSKRYLSGSGWQAAEIVGHEDMESFGGTDIDMDANGNAIVVWAPYIDGNLWANHYIVGSGWQTAEILDTIEVYHGGKPKIAMDPEGNAIAVFVKYNNEYPSIYTQRYTSEVGWEDTILIENVEGSHATRPSITMNNNGDAIVVWAQNVYTETVYSNRYVNNIGWQNIEQVKTTLTAGSSIYKTQVDMKLDNQAVAVWQQGVGEKIMTSSYDPHYGWNIDEIISSKDLGDAKEPQVVMDKSGNSIAVWRQWDGNNWHIYASRYSE